MGDIAIQRIKREFKEVIKSDEAQKCTINIELVADNYQDLKGKIAGPPDTPYEGGIFHLEIKVPETYPFSPPKVRFLTRIWHPNISSATGAICLDILKDQWQQRIEDESQYLGFGVVYPRRSDETFLAAAMTLRTVLLSLQALLAAAEPDDPQDAVVARQYKENHPLYFKTAQYWTFFHAGGDKNNAEFADKVRHLKDMGVNDMQALVALSSCNWEMVQAIEQLFS